jgi:hypothetical protein
MNKRDKEMLEKLRQERARLIRQAEALQNELRGLDRAIALIEAESGEPKARPRNVKDVIDKIVEDAGLVGVTVDEVLNIAKSRGIHLERGTVASNLSRGKSAGKYDAREGRYFFRMGPSPERGDAYASALN